MRNSLSRNCRFIQAASFQTGGNFADATHPDLSCDRDQIMCDRRHGDKIARSDELFDPRDPFGHFKDRIFDQFVKNSLPDRIAQFFHRSAIKLHAAFTRLHKHHLRRHPILPMITPPMQVMGLRS